MRFWSPLAMLAVVALACGGEAENALFVRPDNAAAIQKRLRRYARVTVPDPRASLTERRRQLIEKLVEAASYMDAIFWRQSDHQALRIRDRLLKSTRPLDRSYLRFLDINYGPFDRQAGNEPFIGTRLKPPGAGFYPADLTREELDEYLDTHPDQRQELLSPTTVVRRDGDRLVAVPYFDEHRKFLEPAARALRQAAQFADHPGFRRYLQLRAEALLNDDFYQSDVAWVGLRDQPVDLIIGPIESYEDQLMGIKTAYEGVVLLRDSVETRRLAIYSQHLDELEKQLPVPAAYKKKSARMEAVLGVFTAIYRSGDANAGIKTMAITLPNDERVRQRYGARRLQLKGSILAKYEKILKPIAARLLVPEQAALVGGEAFFTNVLFHEIAHPLGPDFVRSNPEQTPRDALRENYSPIEEAKADIVGLTCVDYFLKKGIISPAKRPAHYATFVASVIRSLRFGVGSAHGKANMIEWNTLVQEGAIEATAAGYRVRFERFPAAVRKLARQLLMLEGNGDYEGARALVAAKAAVPSDLQRALKELGDIPVDLEFRYEVAAPWSAVPTAD